MPLGRRLLVAQALTITVMAVTLVAVAMLVGPPLFDMHMREAGHGEQPSVLLHAREAFQTATGASLAAGILAAAAGAVAVSVAMTRRIGRQLDALGVGAERIGHGVYDEPVPLLGGSGELDQVTAAFNDMAGRIASTEATRRGMLTDLAHEMRTPISAIRLTLEAVEDGVATLDEQGMDAMQAHLERLTRLADDIRAVSAAEEGRLDLHLAHVDLTDVVSHSSGSFAPACEAAGVELLVPRPPHGVVVRGDRARLGQALDNVVRNALQHTPSGGRITITLTSDGKSARIEVADSGQGIAAADLPHLFERFYRADTSRRHHHDGGGTGVGLPISRAIMAAHGGSLDAESEGPGRGATFTLTVPLSG